MTKNNYKINETSNIVKELHFDNELQMILFYCLLNNPNGYTRTELTEIIPKPRSTIYDNLRVLSHTYYHNVPYVKFKPKETGKQGRPEIIWFVPNTIRLSFISII